MGFERQGNAGSPVLLPGSSTSERDDEVINGAAEWEADKSQVATLPQVGDIHPYDTRLKCISVDKTFAAMKVRATCQYMGLVNNPTRKLIQWPGATGQDPIETHEAFSSATADFPNALAGTIGAALNGAYFRPPEGTDDTTQVSPVENPAEFMGFYDQSNSLYGVTAYLVPNPIVYLSYWTTDQPTLDEEMVIVENVPGLISPPSVKNWLFMTPQYREISGGLFYQVTDTYMGSGKKGWNTKVYKTAQ